MSRSSASHRVTRRFKMIGDESSVLARAYGETSLPYEDVTSFRKLVQEGLLIEPERGFVSINPKLRELGSEGLERFNRHEAPAAFANVLELIMGIVNDYVIRVRVGADTTELASAFYSQSVDLAAGFRRSLLRFREQTENVDTQRMRFEEAEHHFDRYQKWMRDYLNLTNAFIRGPLINALNEPLAGDLEVIFQRLVKRHLDDWIAQLTYLIDLNQKALAKLRRTAAAARRLRAVVSHIQSAPSYELPEPVDLGQSWLLAIAPCLGIDAVNWSDADLRSEGYELVERLPSGESFRPRKDRIAGEAALEDDEEEEFYEPPPFMRAFTDWLDGCRGDARLTAMEFYDQDSRAKEHGVRFWLLVVLEMLDTGDWAEEFTHELKTHALWPTADDICLNDVVISAREA